jgi:hypothetical protein
MRLQSREMLDAGQRCGMESNMAVLQLEVFDYESNGQSPTCGR